MTDRTIEEQVVEYLADVHAIEQQALPQVRAAPKLAVAPGARGRRLTRLGAPAAGIQRLQPRRLRNMAKDHGPSVKDDKQYEGLRKRGMSKQRAASIANSPSSSKKGGKKSGKGRGGSKSQKRAAGREGGKKSS
jgi:hypothetical protein